MRFSERVYEAVSLVPRGKVISYSAVAALAGSPGASRAAGRLMASNPRPGSGPGRVPCHRVVRSDGSLGGFTSPRGPSRKRELLESEGIVFEGGRIPGRFFWQP